jgi:hypothetical protein
LAGWLIHGGANSRRNPDLVEDGYSSCKRNEALERNQRLPSRRNINDIYEQDRQRHQRTQMNLSHTSIERLKALMVVVALALPAALRAESLSIAKLQANESVVLVFRSAGCFHYVARFYEIRGGTSPTFGVVEHDTWRGRDEPRRGVDKTLGVGPLLKEEGVGLDAYLLFLRHGAPGGCTTRDVIDLGYYRDGKLIGEEKLVDGSCAVRGFELKDGRIVRSADAELERTPTDFPKAVFSEITPPWLIEERIVEREHTLPKGRTGTATAPVAGQFTLLPLWLADLWPNDQKEARSAAIIALTDASLSSEEYYAEVEKVPDEHTFKLHLWHESALKYRGDRGVRGDPTRKCRTLVFDTESKKITAISLWR